MNFPRRQALRLFSFAFGSALLPAAASLPSAAQSAKPAAPTPAGDKEKVAGIGGFFFRAKDPAALTKWYEEHLGITPARPPCNRRSGTSRRDRHSSRHFLKPRTTSAMRPGSG